MIDTKDSAQTQEIVNGLKDYVAIYQREQSGALPQNMEVIYDYMQEAGETAWTATPAMNVSTRGIEPIGTRLDAGTRSATPTSTQVPNPQPEQPAQKPVQRRKP